jgi:hypothetical protein
MSTLTTEYSSSVKVAQVFADFRRGIPNSGTVYVGAEKHKVHVYRTIGGLMGKCECPSGCAAVPEAINAVKIMAEAWTRIPRTRVQAGIEIDRKLDSAAAPEQRARRPYDGPARIMCEADLVSLDVPRWAYDEQGIRRPVLEAELAQDLWHELHRALGRLLGGRKCTEAAHRSPAIKYYQASWEPDRGLTDAAFGDDLRSGFDDEQLEEFAV